MRCRTGQRDTVKPQMDLRLAQPHDVDSAAIVADSVPTETSTSSERPDNQ